MCDFFITSPNWDLFHIPPLLVFNNQNTVQIYFIVNSSLWNVASPTAGQQDYSLTPTGSFYCLTCCWHHREIGSPRTPWVLFCLRFSSRLIPDQILREPRLSFQCESRLGKQWKSRKAGGERRRTAGNPSITRREQSDLCEHYDCSVSTAGKQMSNTLFSARTVSLWSMETVG